ncbi:MAG: hypothetical protein M5R41_13960 [Bacteroidia bacterium]|nr:hypothetical protein [Bacteroidia bacterium]
MSRSSCPNTQQEVQVRIAADAESRACVHRLREEVFINELGYEIVGSFHEAGVTAQAHSRGALLLAEVENVPVGSMAIDWWIGCDSTSDEIKQYGLGRFLGVFTEEAIVTVRKWLVRDAFRSLKVCKALLRAAVQFVEDKPSVQFVCIDCVGELVDHYRTLGFRQYAAAFRYGAGGALCVPMCLVLDDHHWLNAIRSPLLPLLKAIGRFDNPVARACFDQIVHEWQHEEATGKCNTVGVACAKSSRAA